MSKPTPGANALVRWLKRNSRGQFWGIMRCEKLSKRNYSLHSDRTLAHRDHVHLGLNRAGARKRTSFWARR